MCSRSACRRKGEGNPGTGAGTSWRSFPQERLVMQIYGDLGSGNCLKVKYTADHLGLRYTWVAIDIMAGQARADEFVGKFPMAQIPAVEFDDGRRLAQSNAIVRYLAQGSRLLPSDPFVAAKIDELLFWEQYSHEPNLAVCRFHMRY